MSNYFIQTYTWNPWHNLAVEKYLSTKIKEGDVILYLWQNERTVVIGRNQNAIRECRAQLLDALPEEPPEEGLYITIWVTSVLHFWYHLRSTIWKNSFKLYRRPAGSLALKRSFQEEMIL